MVKSLFLAQKMQLYPFYVHRLLAETPLNLSSVPAA